MSRPDGEDNTVRGYVLRWGDPDHKDLQGEYFIPETELGGQVDGATFDLVYRGPEQPFAVVGRAQTQRTQEGVRFEGSA